MKKISKLLLTFALCMSSLVAISFSNVKADDNDTYTVQYNEEKSTYDSDKSVRKFTIYFVIPEEASNYKYVKLDLGKAMVDGISNFIQSPGDWFNFDIIIENESGVNYNYQSGSLTVNDPDMVGGVNANQWGVKAFDGELLDVEYVPYRIGNAAAIYKGLFSLSSSSRVTGKLMFTIDEKLASLGYTGNDALTRYLLDYYNDEKNGFNKDGINATQIKDLDSIALKNIFSSGIKVNSNGTYTLSDVDYASLSDEQKSKIEHVSGNRYRFRETETELAEYYYNYFYDWCIGLQFGNYVNRLSANSTILNERTVSTSSIVKLYDNLNNVRTEADNYIESTLTPKNLKAGGEARFVAGYTIDGPLTGNNAQCYDFGFNTMITLEKEVKGTLSVAKTINYGPYETSDNPFFIFKATNVDTGEAYYRVLALSDLKMTGNVVFEDLPLGTYTVHEFNPIRYSREEDKTVTITSDSPVGNVEFNNSKIKDNDFSDSDMVINSFTKNEDNVVTITQRKVTVTETE